MGEGSTISSKSFGFNQPTTCCWKICERIAADGIHSPNLNFPWVTPPISMGLNRSIPVFGGSIPVFLWPPEIALANPTSGKVSTKRIAVLNCGKEPAVRQEAMTQAATHAPALAYDEQLSAQFAELLDGICIFWRKPLAS